MNKRLKKLFDRGMAPSDADYLGEDMAPSPSTLAERSALSTETGTQAPVVKQGPFSSSAAEPMRDFTD